VRGTLLLLRRLVLPEIRIAHILWSLVGSCRDARYGKDDIAISNLDE